jgi:hypothetical protein
MPVIKGELRCMGQIALSETTVSARPGQRRHRVKPITRDPRRTEGTTSGRSAYTPPALTGEPSSHQTAKRARARGAEEPSPPLTSTPISEVFSSASLPSVALSVGVGPHDPATRTARACRPGAHVNARQELRTSADQPLIDSCPPSSSPVIQAATTSPATTTPTRKRPATDAEALTFCPVVALRPPRRPSRTRPPSC